jgi:hypothetical protein
MKSAFLCLLSLLALSLLATSPAALSAAETQQGPMNTVSLTGIVATYKDKSGNISAVTVKTDKGLLAVPTKNNDKFAPYEGKSVRFCCLVNGKTLVPLFVTGLEQKQRIPMGTVR